MPSRPACSSQKPAPDRGQAHPTSSVSGTFHSPLGPPTGSSLQACPFPPSAALSSCCHLLPAVTSLSCLFHVPSGDCVSTRAQSQSTLQSRGRGANLTDPHLSMGLHLSPPIHTATPGAPLQPAAYSGRVLRWQCFAFPRGECSVFSIESFLTNSHSPDLLQLL